MLTKACIATDESGLLGRYKIYILLCMYHHRGRLSRCGFWLFQSFMSRHGWFAVHFDRISTLFFWFGRGLFCSFPCCQIFTGNGSAVNDRSSSAGVGATAATVSPVP